MSPTAADELGPDNFQPLPGSQTAQVLKDRRFKLSRACDRCRRRRIKCDEGHPCQACQGTSSDCTFDETVKRTNPHKSKRTTTLEDRMRQLETLIEAIPPSVFAAIQTSGNVDTTGIVRPPLPAAAMNIPVANPAGHFASGAPTPALPNLLQQRFGPRPTFQDPMDALVDAAQKMSLAPPSMFFVDGMGHTRWHGETSCLPLLDFLVDSHAYRPPFNPHNTSRAAVKESESGASPGNTAAGSNTSSPPTSMAPEVDGEGPPEVIWNTITSIIPAELMDELVKGFLSTSYYLLPFLHLPSFLADYGDPSKWSDIGFATFIVSLCCISSLHIDNSTVRASGVGLRWFELFGQLRSLPGADRPTLYTVQAILIGAVFAVGQGMHSRALALMAEAVTLAMDAGLHRSADAYDWFDAIEDQVRKRTFWCIYIWDKQAAAQFGRPPMIRLRDCDIDQPAPVDDEYITINGISAQPPGSQSRLSAFVCLCHLSVVLDAVLDTPPSRTFTDTPNSFLDRATRVISGAKANGDLREEEALLNDVVKSIPPHWSHSPETLASMDVVRITQAERLHCFEYYIRMLIYRHRFSVCAAARVANSIDMPKTEAEFEAIKGVHACASRIIAVHLNIATRGLMTYYGIHVVHQLTQTGRTLVAIFLECRNDDRLKDLVPSILEGLRSTFSLLRHFSGRYICGMRATDMMEEVCYLTQIPLNIPAHLSRANTIRSKWVQHIQKKATPSRKNSYQPPSVGFTTGTSEQFGTQPFAVDPRQSFSSTSSTTMPSSGSDSMSRISTSNFAPSVTSPLSGGPVSGHSTGVDMGNSMYSSISGTPAEPLNLNTNLWSMAGDVLPQDQFGNMGPAAMGGGHVGVGGDMGVNLSGYTHVGSGMGTFGNGTGGIGNAMQEQLDINEFLASLGADDGNTGTHSQGMLRMNMGMGGVYDHGQGSYSHSTGGMPTG